MYAAVMSWVRHDIARRQHAELDRLLRLVRHPATSSRAPLLEDELMLQHTELRCNILYHCQHEFQQSVKNIDHYQLRPRINCYGFGEFDSVHQSMTILAAGAAVRKEAGFDHMSDQLPGLPFFAYVVATSHQIASCSPQVRDRLVRHQRREGRHDGRAAPNAVRTVVLLGKVVNDWDLLSEVSTIGQHRRRTLRYCRLRVQCVQRVSVS